MKIFLVLIALCVSTGAVAGALDGKKYCRTVVSNGGFGQPPGTRENCISFAADVASDNSNTFFGNPPQRFPYSVNGQKVLFGTSAFTLSLDLKSLMTVTGSTVAGTVFNITK